MRRELLATFLSAAVTALVTVACGSPSTGDRVQCNENTCQGCCSPEGQCFTGTTDQNCGSQGVACSTCIAGNTCFHQACVYTLGQGDGGTDAGGDTDAGDLPDSGTTDADGGSTGSDGGLAITAPKETWTWVDFPDSACGNGTATGLGVNLTDKSTDVFIYLQGGGACWNALTCFTLQTAANLNTGYDAQKFAGDAFKAAYAVNRGQSGNPFKDMSYVYIPYCTGDVHAGDNVKTYDSTHPAVHHVGAKNMDAYFKRLAATFPDATRIFLGGSSAGAYGAQLNFERAKAAFPTAEIHVLADSGQMITPAGTLYADWISAWNLTLPAACAECATDFTRFPEYLATTYPNTRFGLLAYDQDSVLRQFFGYTATEFQTRTMDLLTTRYDPHANARYYWLQGSTHTMLGSLDSVTNQSGVTLNSWVTQWVTGDAAWTNAGP